MRIQLKEITNIHMGFSFRTRLEPARNGSVAIIQMKDLSADNKVNMKNTIRIEMSSLKAKHLTKLGDVLFRSRGHNSESALLATDPGVAIVASPLMRIRILDSAKILPEYLNWFISQPEAQAFFASRAEGTTQRMISKKELESLEVELPNLEKQRLICELSDLYSLETKLTTRILELGNKVISEKLMTYARGGVV